MNISGAWEIYSAGSASDGGSASGPGVEANFRDGVEWHRQVKFDQPVFFAFKLTRNNFGGWSGDQLESKLEDQGTLQRASEGVARFVKDECWRPGKNQGPEGWRYQNKVLAFIPRAQVAEAVQALGQAVGQ